MRDFLSGLATDPNKLSAYLNDPEAAMEAAGLAETDREALRNNEFTRYGSLPTIMVFVVVKRITQP